MSPEATPQGSDVRTQATEIVDVRRLLHPGERARFWMALATLTLVAGLFLVVVVRVGGWSVVGGAAVVVILAWALAWIALQLHRVRLLGRYVRVTERSLPALAQVISEQRRRLGFSKRVDFYVADEVAGTISYTSYFGTKIVVIKGDLVADLDDEDRRVQSTYLVGSVLGHLAAKHLRFTPVLIAISALTKVKVFNLLLSPYFRATWYSGDNVGLFLCESPRAGVEVMHRILVGKELSPAVNTSGLLDQATEVRRRALPRLIALFSNAPHLTDRYLNVLCYLDHQFPTEALQWREGLDSETSGVVTRELMRSPYRTNSQRRGTIWAALTAVSVAIVIAAAVLILPKPTSAASAPDSRPTQAALPTDVGPSNTGAALPPPSSSVSAETNSAEPTGTTTPTQLHLQVGPIDDGACAAHATGQVAEYLSTAGCDLARSLLTTNVDGRPVLISFAEILLSDPTTNADFISLITANGTGDINSLLADGRTFPGAPNSFADDPTFLAQEETHGVKIEVLKAMWMDNPASATADTPGLRELLAEIA